MKGYVCLFICLATRAVYLELAEDNSSEAFIATFHRFTARRGHCSEIQCHRRPNFIADDSELNQMFQESSTFAQIVSQILVKENTTFSFNLPAQPHFGGIWEAGVKTTKHHLSRVIGKTIMTFSEMSTLLCCIEACLKKQILSAAQGRTAGSCLSVTVPFFNEKIIVSRTRARLCR